MEKIDLGKMADNFYAKENAKKYQLAVDYVETSLIPHLTSLAEQGTRFVVVAPPPNVLLHDVCKALTAKVACNVEPSGFRGRIRISW